MIGRYITAALRAAAVAALGCLLFVPGLDQALAAERHAGDAATTARIVAPAAPPTIKNPGPTTLAATSPTISPSVTTRHVSPGDTYTCSHGNLCTLVWDPTSGSWKIFYLYYCNRYSLAYWQGGGYYWNNQTSGTLARFMGENGTIFTFSRAPSSPNMSQDWNPIYSIINC